MFELFISRSNKTSIHEGLDVSESMVPNRWKKYLLLNCSLKNICFAKMKKAHYKIQNNNDLYNESKYLCTLGRKGLRASVKVAWTWYWNVAITLASTKSAKHAPVPFALSELSRQKRRLVRHLASWRLTKISTEPNKNQNKQKERKEKSKN